MKKKNIVTCFLLLLSGCCPVFAQTVSDYAAFTKKWEGYSAMAYRDNGGRSIGYGHHIQPHEKIPSVICREKAEKLLKEDIRKAIVHARENVKTFDRQPTEVKKIIVDMAYQNGKAGQKKFEKTIDALNRFDYITASKEMKDSRWYDQSGQRSRNHVREIAGQ
jgi:GH24 family phage-related lysozyme (muramidase)